MRNALPARGRPWFRGPLVVALLSALTLCLSAAPAGAHTAVGAHADHETAALSPAARQSLSIAAGTPLPAGGVLSNISDTGADGIVAIDPGGNLWWYPNTGTDDQRMFADGRSKVGTGWTGYQLAAVSALFGPYDGGGKILAQAGILAIDPAGRLWYYPNNGGTPRPSLFGARSQVGTGWTGYTVVGLTDLYGTVDQSGIAFAGVLAIDPAGRLWYYPGTGDVGTLSTFGARSLVGIGWTGYTADVADINNDGSPDILAVDSAGTMWLYPNIGGSGTSTFGDPAEVSTGWSGYQAVDVGLLTHGSGGNDILGIDSAGNLWSYPNSDVASSDPFGAPVQVGIGWTGFRIN